MKMKIVIGLHVISLKNGKMYKILKVSKKFIEIQDLQYACNYTLIVEKDNFEKLYKVFTF